MFSVVCLTKKIGGHDALQQLRNHLGGPDTGRSIP